MNKEMLRRIKTAGEYQKKAVRALFPEKIGRHLDVIEKEIKMMAMEIAADAGKGCKNNEAKPSSVRKVDIL